MGNTNVKEGEDNAGQDPTGNSAGDGSFPIDFMTGIPANSGGGRVASTDSMGNTPPHSPGRSRSPLLFAPQVPVAPLQRPADISSAFNQSWLNDSHAMDLSQEQGIPTMITWNSGGNDVAVEGSWDNWMSRKSLQRSGKDHAVLLVLPSGVYQYKFIVDGEWRYIPDLPCIADETGHVNNLLDVQEYVPESLESIAEFEPPLSPDSSYNQPFPVTEDFSKEPPLVPPHLHLTVLGMRNQEGANETCARPQHVVLNHLFIEKGWGSQSLVALGLTHRFQSKYVTVVLYKPLRR